MQVLQKLIVGCTIFAFTFALQAQSAGPPPPAVLQQNGLARFLEGTEKPVGPEAEVPYAAVPPELDGAVRMTAMDNFSSATAELQKLLPAAADNAAKVRINIWLGLAYGSQAISYPSTGWQNGTSATAHLKKAIELDPQAILAPDVARILAEMVAHGWASEDPATALQRAEQKAEETRRAIDFYFAGVISRRLSARAWGYSDTTEQDQKTLALFAKSIAREPARYETWSAYLPALLPAGMHDLATTEGQAMFSHFSNLRTPLLNDQGPAALMLSVSSYRTTEQDRKVLDEVARKWPDAPMPPFEIAMRAIETSPSLAMELFPKLIQRFESGDIKPLPREAGYYPSTLYKYAFLLQSVGQVDKSIEYYKKVREISPGYAELNLNIAILLAQQSDKETTGPKKLELLERALPYAEAQEKLDYRGKAALKAGEIRQRLRSVIYRVKQELKTSGTAVESR
jgi:tetratricopeptide (TPR) repeat protein